MTRKETLAFVILALASLAACTSPRSDSAFKLRAVHAGVAFYKAERGVLPPDLRTVCATNSSWCRLRPADEWILDEYGTPIRYVTHPDGYVLSAAGLDRHFGTRDDLDFDSREDWRRAQRMSGCYQLTPRIARLDSDTLELGESISRSGGYVIRAPIAIGTDTASHAEWYPVADDAFVASWVGAERGISLTARVTAGGLEGRVGDRTIGGRKVTCSP